MALVTIIEVDLGLSVKELLEADVMELTGQARKEVDQAIQTNKEVLRVKQKVQEEKKNITDAISNCLEKVYEELRQAGENGLPIAQITAIITPHIANLSAFTLRFKKILKDKGNPYYIERIKVSGEQCYVMRPFAQPDPDPIID